MVRTLNFHKQRGFTIIEALFSSIVLGIGLLALAGFHAVALQDGTAVKMRTVATNLAQEKLDDLKSFSRLFDDTNLDENGDGVNNNDCGNGTFCYTEIASNAGGQEHSDGTLKLPQGNAGTYSNTAYTREWSVVCYSETASGAPTVNADCTDADFKKVTVTIKWYDNKGVLQSASLQAVIYGIDPARIARATAALAPGPGPKVSYTPVGVPDAVPVPINTGGSKYKETSKPLPEVSQSGDGINVSFTTVVYTGSGTYKRESQEDVSTVTCECQFVSGTNNGYTPARKVWNGYALEVQPGSQVSKTTGQPLGNNPPSNCDVCCRDHHDFTSSAYPKYDPQRPVDDYTSGDHKHYWYTNCVTAGAGEANCTNNSKDASLNSGTPFTAVTSGAYLESCRLQRVDGIWRVMQDWRLRKVTVLPYDYLTNNTNLTNYINVVEDVVENAVKVDSGASGVTVGTLSGRDLPSMESGDDPVQLLSRAIYVDTIYGAEDDPDTGDNELYLPDSTYYTALLAAITASQSAGNSDWLENASFYEANLTLLFDWTSSNTSIATVSSQEISAIYDPANNYYGSFSRGSVAIQSGATAGSSVITAKARISNSGVTGGVNRNSGYIAGQSFGTDNHDNLSTNTLTDSITVSRVAGGTNVTITGKILKGNSSVNVSTTSPLSVTANTKDGTSGTVVNACGRVTNADASAWYYSCTVSSGWEGTLSFTSTSNVYTFGNNTDTSYTTGEFTASSDVAISNVVAYGGTAAIRGRIYTVEQTGGGYGDKVDIQNTTVSFSGSVGFTTTNGTCTKYAQVIGAGTPARTEQWDYFCLVPVGWSGTVNVDVDESGLASGTSGHTYYSPPYPLAGTPSPCNAATGSCTMATIPAVLADVDGTSGTATPAQKQMTNVTARR